MNLDKNWLSIFYIPKADMTVEKYDELIANIDSNIEYYFIKEVAKNVLNSIIITCESISIL
jgi:hypothetical protein